MPAVPKTKEDPILPRVVHHLLLLASVLTYFFDPEDGVWRLIKHSPHVRPLEHLCFGVAAATLGIVAWLRISVRRLRLSDTSQLLGGRRYLITILHACGIGSLLPLSGFLLLVVGDIALLIFRPKWRVDFGKISGWCAFVSMLVFAITLNDRMAEVLFAAAALVSLLPSS